MPYVIRDKTPTITWSPWVSTWYGWKEELPFKSNWLLGKPGSATGKHLLQQVRLSEVGLLNRNKFSKYKSDSKNKLCLKNCVCMMWGQWCHPLAFEVTCKKLQTSCYTYHPFCFLKADVTRTGWIWLWNWRLLHGTVQSCDSNLPIPYTVKHNMLLDKNGNHLLQMKLHVSYICPATLETIRETLN